MNVEFHAVRNSDRAFNSIRSTADTIKFRLVRRANNVTFDADWYHLPVEMSRSTYREIESCWNAERKTHPCKGDFGGGRSCLILTIHPQREGFWKSFLGDRLSNANSWVSLHRKVA